MTLSLHAALFVAASSIPSVLALLIGTERAACRIRKLLTAGMITITLIYNAYYFSPPVFRASESLPLQVCDLLGFVAAVAFVTRWRLARAILVLSAIPFVSQAVLTPVGDQQATSLRTWLYWVFHGFIFACFIFEIMIARFRPEALDLAKLFVVDAAYVVAIGALNIRFGWNYGYIGDAKPDAITLIDTLGPWPARVFIMLALAMLLQAICFLLFRGWGREHDFRG